MTKEDFSRRSAIFLRPEARFDHLVALPDGEDNDRLYRHAVRLMETCEKECDAKSGDAWNDRDITRARKAADEARRNLTKQDESAPVHAWGQLRKVRYFWRQARWITERFPGAELRDVVGLIKLVDRAEIEANDWSLTPGRYVGVAPEEEGEDFDFGEAMRAIHAELDDLDAEAATLAATIRKNFEGWGYDEDGDDADGAAAPRPLRDADERGSRGRKRASGVR